MHMREAGLDQHSLGGSWERAEFETDLPDHSRTVQREISPAKDLIEQLYSAIKPVEAGDQNELVGAQSSSPIITRSQITLRS